MFSVTKSITFWRSSSVRSKSILLMMTVIFLPLLPDIGHELSLALGERAIGRCNEQDKVGPRHGNPGERLVLWYNSVRTRGVDQEVISSRKSAG